jgi:hypothetical protein
MTRRDQCYFVGKRAYRLHPVRAGYAWYYLATRLEEMGNMDVPKFRHLLHTVRKATILAAKLDTTIPINHPLYEHAAEPDYSI